MTRPQQQRRSLPSIRILERLFAGILGRRVFAVAMLTLKATFRYRLIQVLLILLAAAVVGLPAIIKHDGTAQGFTQILLTYTLGAITVLLGFATLWLGCGTLSREVEECQIQVLAVKPIQRWEIWLGKWLGIVSLNALLLGLSGLTVFALMQWRASRLPPEVQAELRQKILVARGSAGYHVAQAEIDRQAQTLYRERVQGRELSAADREYLRSQAQEAVKREYQIVPSGALRRWPVSLGRHADKLRGQPLTVRAKFFSATTGRAYSATFGGWWAIGPPDGQRHRPEVMSLAPDTFHEFSVPPGYIDDSGTLVIDFYNFNDSALLFPLEDGLEVLYPEGGFGLNFVRAMGILFCWMALLAAIGLTTGSYLSFPVAAFCAVGILLVSASTGTLQQIVNEGGITGVNPETGRIDSPALLDQASIAVAKTLIWTIGVARDFSPIDSLSSGRSVTWYQLALAFAQIVVALGGLFATAGIVLFTRRELAIAQGA